MLFSFFIFLFIFHKMLHFSGISLVKIKLFLVQNIIMVRVEKKKIFYTNLDFIAFFIFFYFLFFFYFFLFFIFFIFFFFFFFYFIFLFIIFFSIIIVKCISFCLYPTVTALLLYINDCVELIGIIWHHMQHNYILAIKEIECREKLGTHTHIYIIKKYL